MLENIIILIIAASAAALFFIPSAKNKKPKTTQELLFFKEITPDGIVELSDNKYRMVLEVQPTNVALKSPGEQEAIWLSFRSMINSLVLPMTLMVQSRHLDLSQYLEEVTLSIENQKTNQLKQYAAEIVEDLKNKIEEKTIRDKKYYILIKIDTGDMADIDSGVTIENEMLNSIAKGLKKQTLNVEDARNLARQELENASNVVMSGLDNMGISAWRLGKIQVLDLIYATYNRDMAAVLKMTDAQKTGMFSVTPIPMTPFMAGGAVIVQEEQKAE